MFKKIWQRFFGKSNPEPRRKPDVVEDPIMGEILNRCLQTGKSMSGTIDYDSDGKAISFTVDDDDEDHLHPFMIWH